MPQNPFVISSTQVDRKAIVQAAPAVASAARWFWWIAGLSLVNSFLIHSGSQTSFVVGLGFTLIADVTFQELKVVAFLIDALAIGFFVGVGFAALRGYVWAFVVGAIVYTLDALIYLYFQDFMPLAFHAFALFCIVRGALELRTALAAAKALAASNTSLQPASPPVLTSEKVEAATDTGATQS